MTFSLRILTIVRSPGTASGSTDGLTTALGYESHGVPFNGNYPSGVETLISKNSNGARFTLVPNGLGQTHVGIKGEEHIVSDWSLVFKFENGFDPYTCSAPTGRNRWLKTTPLRLTRKLRTATRAGQASSSTLRPISDSAIRLTVTCLRGGRTPLSSTARAALIPWARRQAFPYRRFQYRRRRRRHAETARYNTSLKYRIGVGPFHFAGLYQFGGYDQGNGSNGAFSLGMTGDFGPLSFGVEGEKNKDAVSLSNFAQFPLPSGVSANALKATLSNNTSGIVGVRYTFGNAALYSGWEYILFANPTDAYPDGFTAIGNYPVPAGFVNSTAYTEHKILRVFWTGVKYALRDNLDVAGAYYHYYQNDYNTAPCTDGGLSASSCRGALNAFSAMISYRPAKRVEAYGGFLWSQVTGGLASGYLYRVNFAPTIGVRVNF